MGAMRRRRERTPRLQKKGNGQTRPVALTFLGGHLVDPSPHAQLERPEKRHHGGIRQRRHCLWDGDQRRGAEGRRSHCVVPLHHNDRRILLLPVPAIHCHGVVPDNNHPHADGRKSPLQVWHVPPQSSFDACIAPSAESVGIISDIARLLPCTSQQSCCHWCCMMQASWSPETAPVMSASFCKLAIEKSGIAQHAHLLPRGIVLRPLAGAAHQVGASTRSTRPLGPNMTTELNALLLTSRLRHGSGPRQRAWMKHQRNKYMVPLLPK